MSEPRSVLFWQDIPSIHQAPLIASVARRVSTAVLLENDLPNYRRRSGWEWPDFGEARVLSISEGLSSNLIDQVPTPCIHVFSGLGAYPLVLSAFVGVTERRLNGDPRHIVCVQTEGVKSRGIKGKARLARFLARATRYGRGVDHFLLIGTHAERQLGRLPCIGRRSSSFAYYSDSGVFAQSVDSDRLGSSSYLRLVYVGRLLKRKRVDVLLDAVAKAGNVTLDVFGEGDLLPGLQARTALSSGERVRWRGSVSHSEVPGILRSYDALCLPSDHDGWGVPVNEALLAGMKVFVSDGVGASVVVKQDPLLGEVFPRGNVPALAERLAASTVEPAARRRERSKLSTSLLGAEAGASKLLQVATSSISYGGVV